MSRAGKAERQTRETTVKAAVQLDDAAELRINTGIPFFDHMLTALGTTSRLGIEIEAVGDLAVDPHHTVEDVGITFGQALRKSLGDGSGISRYGEAAVPMDDALVQVVLDISGRPYAACHGDLPARQLGGFHSDLLREWLWGLARGMQCTVHVRMLAGQDTHHQVEAAFKGLGLALARAVAPASAGIPSSKGTLFDA